MEKLKNTLKDKRIYMFLLITLVFFGMFLKMDFATDTYSVFGDTQRNIFNHFLLSGRMVTAMWWGISCKLNMSQHVIYILSFLLAIFSITLSLYKVYKIIKEDIKSDILSILLSTIIIINPFSIELFMYIEKGILTLAILLCVCALEKFIEYLKIRNNEIDSKTKSKAKSKTIIISMLFMLIATFSYQGVLAIFVALATVYIIKYSKGVKKFITNNLILLLIYALPAMINLLVVRIFFTNSRVSGAIIIPETINKIIAGTKNMLVTYNIIPRYLYLAFIAIAIILILIKVFMRKEKISEIVLNILSIIYISVITILITIAPQALQNTASIWFVSRSTYAFASLLGILILFGVMIRPTKEYSEKTIEENNSKKSIEVNSKIKDDKIEKNINNIKFEKTNKIFEIIFTIICLAFILIEFYRFNIIEIDHYNENYRDKINSLKIGEMIKEYEEKNKVEVTKISIYQDKNLSYVYQGLFSTGDINITGFSPDWSVSRMINYYNNRNLLETENDKQIKEEFEANDWNDFNENEVIIKGDTIHFCRF